MAHMDKDVNPVVSTQNQITSIQAQEVRSYRYGEFIFEEGASNNQFAAILSGNVQILCRGKKVRVLGELDVLGLQNVFFKNPSPVSAMALTACRVAFYGPDALNHFLRGDAVMSERLLKSVVKQLTQTTQRAAGGEREFSLDDVKMRFYSDDEVIIEEGSQRSEFYRLVSTEGGLRICIQGKEIARLSRPGEFFGEMETLLNLPCQATVTSDGESVVQVYPGDQLPTMVESYPEVALQMIRGLASRLMDINRKFVNQTP
jgi:CRP-like cAMP-binding protein